MEDHRDMLPAHQGTYCISSMDSISYLALETRPQKIKWDQPLIKTGIYKIWHYQQAEIQQNDCTILSIAFKLSPQLRNVFIQAMRTCEQLISLMDDWSHPFICYMYCNAMPTAGTRHLFKTQPVLISEPSESPASNRDRRLFGGGFYSSIYSTLTGVPSPHPLSSSPLPSQPLPYSSFLVNL